MPSGTYRIAADLVVALHAAFVIFVLFGGILAFRWRWVTRVHVPAALWGVAIEIGGWTCPLTPLENALWQHGTGAVPYRGDFIEHYVLPVLYPAQLTRTAQIFLGLLAMAVNVVVYWQVVRTAARWARVTTPSRRTTPSIGWLLICGAFEHRQFPSLGRHVVPQDVGIAFRCAHFEVAMVWSEPCVEHLAHVDDAVS